MKTVIALLVVMMGAQAFAETQFACEKGGYKMTVERSQATAGIQGQLQTPDGKSLEMTCTVYEFNNEPRAIWTCTEASQPENSFQGLEVDVDARFAKTNAGAKVQSVTASIVKGTGVPLMGQPVTDLDCQN